MVTISEVMLSVKNGEYVVIDRSIKLVVVYEKNEHEERIKRIYQIRENDVLEQFKGGD
jgi:hypothetical protein